jgi:hypothetical protein
MLLPNPLLANTRDRPPKTAMKKNVNTYVLTGKSVFCATFSRQSKRPPNWSTNHPGKPSDGLAGPLHGPGNRQQEA